MNRQGGPYPENQGRNPTYIAKTSLRGPAKIPITIVERDPTGEEVVVARARLPDGGWGTIVSRGIRQHLLREGLPPSSVPPLTRDQERDWIACQAADKPNALSALSMTVRADRRQLGLAEMLVEAMKQTARAEGLQALVVPLRPTRKAEFPLVPMQDYMTWKNTNEVPSTIAATSPPSMDNGHPAKHELPFDPWLRKHISLGGTMVKVATCNMVVHGSITEWQEWTGVDFNHHLQEIQSKDVKKELESNRDYLEISFPRGLAPLRFTLAIFPNPSSTSKPLLHPAYGDPQTFLCHILFTLTFLDMAPTYTGSCKCSAIKIEMQGEPDMKGLCHCTNCRKSTGSTYSTNAMFSKSAFTIISGEPKVYEAEGGSGNPAFVNFCGNCGSTMWTLTPLRPDIVVIKVGILDGDALEKLGPKLETFTSRKPSWMKSVDGAAQFENGFVAPPSQ
ncbi:hypothetical protein V500_08977 [Pseudogymnoascus sp. VKM F-4518 (FW-2643)]|nr:hypothetical protein V500_08977 [Pseudogymnoascus sp. VKM F-4518 (FW-2643)]